MSLDFALQVSSAMTEEIERLHVLIDQFNEGFSSDSLVIKVYKEVSGHVVFLSLHQIY